MYAKDAIEQWGEYLGSNSKPKDFDEFWDNGKKLVDNANLSYELVEHELYSKVVDGYELNFKAIDGAHIHCQFFKPKNVTGKLPVMILFHGYHVNVGDWSDKIGTAAEGMIVVAMDVRGQGGKSEDITRTKGGTLKGHIIRGVDEGPENLFFRSVFLDIYQLTQIIFSMEDVDAEQVHTYGASQGGAQAIVCAALEPRVKKAFALYPFLSDYREAYRNEVNSSAYEELSYWFRFRDPLHTKEEKFFNTLDYIDIQYLAPRIKAQVYWGIGLEDQVCQPKTQFAVYNQLTCQKEMIIYPEHGHEHMPGFSDFMRSKM